MLGLYDSKPWLLNPNPRPVQWARIQSMCLSPGKLQLHDRQVAVITELDIWFLWARKELGQVNPALLRSEGKGWKEHSLAL